MRQFKKLFCIGAAALVMACSAFLLSHDRLRGKAERLYKRVDVALNLPGAVPASSHLLQPETLKGGLGNPSLWIAHGGGIGEYVYTNCEEAVKDSLNRGFTYIELDLMETTDGHLVGGHSWAEVRRLAGVAGNEPLSRAELEALRQQWKQTLLFAEDICRLMAENPQMILVTDKSQDFELLRREIPYPDRMVIEAFGCHNYLRALRAGFKHVALTVWSLYDLQQAQKYKLSGVVLSAIVLKEDPAAVKLTQQLHADGCCITVHWASVCDTPEFVHEWLGRNISRIYTDRWSPAQPPPGL